MKVSVLKILALMLFSATCYAGTSIPAASLTAMVNKGTCSLDKDNWCPTYAEDTDNGGFILNATAETVQYMDLNYANLKVPCRLWKLAGGKENAIAVLKIIDQEGKLLLMMRYCQ
ncbi:MAG: hypothetical protein HOG41_09900 [Gammaproteobacteria bacterium]|jgi:hypothetical protein|nr:hypothetical protein [Gammaproteobacteria bacterium]MBT4194011.1 hypothetical protein [Gammaproteobacteria bacterium]